MKNLYFDDFEDLACDIADTYDSLKGKDFEDVAIVAKYEEARQIIKELICIGYDIHSLEIHDELWENYNSEFIISLYDNELWCEPMLRENGYIDEESPVIYVLDNCSSKVIPYCKGKTVYEVTVGDDDCSCDECECTYKKDEKPTANTAKSTYKVNGKECSKETYDEALRTIEDMYTKNIREALSGYSDLIDEMYKWKRLLNW